jgi:hypothetical protein
VDDECVAAEVKLCPKAILVETVEIPYYYYCYCWPTYSLAWYILAVLGRKLAVI